MPQLLFDMPVQTNGFRDSAFAKNKILPVHRWVPWIAGFSAQFVDDCISAYLTRRYGRAPAGERIREAPPAGHWSALTLRGARTPNGMPARRTVESATAGAVFLAYREPARCPALRPGQGVGRDPRSAPQVAGVRQRIAAAGAPGLYLTT